LQVLYEDPDEEDRESGTIKDVNSTIIKTINYQQIEEPIIEKHMEKSILNPDSDNDFSIKSIETSRSTTVIISIFIFF